MSELICISDDCTTVVVRPFNRGPVPRRCQPCKAALRNERTRQWRAANPEKARIADTERQRRAREINPGHRAGHEKSTPERRRRQRRSYALARFGLTISDYERMLAQQGGKCAICPRTPSGQGRNLAVDHDHKCCPASWCCGQCVRGLLCDRCNTAIGLLNDDLTLMLKSLDYVKKFSKGEATEFE